MSAEEATKALNTVDGKPFEIPDLIIYESLRSLHRHQRSEQYERRNDEQGNLAIWRVPMEPDLTPWADGLNRSKAKLRALYRLLSDSSSGRSTAAKCLAELRERFAKLPLRDRTGRKLWLHSYQPVYSKDGNLVRFPSESIRSSGRRSR
jgi:hypothetical protein